MKPVKFVGLAIMGILAMPAAAQPVVAKAQVAEKIRRVENGVDEFRNYLERRGDNARSASSTSQAQGRRARRGEPTEAQKSAARDRKDDLEDALGDLNRSTNRLRRKFDATDTWMQTKVEVERVLDDGRRINQAIVRGNYGAEAARLWAALRTQINDLARFYNLAPLAV